jgi:ATP-binding cassette subfamily C protein
MAVIALLLGIIFTLLKKRLVIWSAILQRREANLISHLQEGLGGVKDVLVFGVRDFFLGEFGRNVVHRSRMKRNRDFAVLVPRFVIETLMMIGMAGALLWLSGAGSIEQNFAVITFFAVAVVRMLPMSNRIMASVSALRSCEPSINVVYENTRPTGCGNNELSNPVVESNPIPFQALEIENLSFSYVADIPLLADISFSVNSGETIGIVGSSGAGKTTLVDLLLGLLSPTSGQIKQNGCDIQDDIAAWQRRVGYVQQSIFLLDDTIEANIAFGIPEEQVDQERVKDVVRLAKLASWVEQLPDGIQSKVGERGVSISGGQRQRIGIARALYRSPELLILDEATSALDNRTEKELMADIYSMRGEHTIVLIAHRLDTIRKCDRIVVLDQGNIAGIGTYDELLSKNSVFQQISAQR